MALPFLPSHEIPEVFNGLKDQAVTRSLRHIVDYMQRQWIESTIFPIKDWSIFGQPIRTNNDIEGIITHQRHATSSGNYYFFLSLMLRILLYLIRLAPRAQPTCVRKTLAFLRINRAPS